MYVVIQGLNPEDELLVVGGVAVQLAWVVNPCGIERHGGRADVTMVDLVPGGQEIWGAKALRLEDREGHPQGVPLRQPVDLDLETDSLALRDR